MIQERAETEPAVSAKRLEKHYEDGRITALDCLDLDVAAGDFVAVCGPSGCGKSTTLRMVAGLEEVTDGTIRIGDRVERPQRQSHHFADSSWRR